MSSEKKRVSGNLIKQSNENLRAMTSGSMEKDVQEQKCYSWIAEINCSSV